MGDIELQIFSDKLKELRSSLGLTQAEFVDGLGITASSLSAYEKNLKNPSVSVAKRIAEKYKVSIDWLCGLSEQKNLTQSFTTYQDIANTLFEIDASIDAAFGEENTDYGTITYLSFDDIIMNDFMKEWLEATNVLNNTSINREITKTMYESWKKSKLDELGKKKLKKRKKI